MRMPHPHSSFQIPSQRGNALFLILIAVALFAALSYAITKSGGGSGSISSESALMEVVRLENYASQIRNALLRMRLTEGIEEWQVDYSDPTSESAAAANPNCTSASCRLFDPAGGGVQKGFRLNPRYKANNVGLAPWGGKFFFRNLAVQGLGQELQRDLFIVYLDVTREFCLAVNRHAGVPNDAGEPYYDWDNGENTASGFRDYSGNIAAQVDLASAGLAIGDEAAAINKFPMFCIRSWQGQDYYYVWISLLDR